MARISTPFTLSLLTLSLLCLSSSATAAQAAHPRRIAPTRKTSTQKSSVNPGRTFTVAPDLTRQPTLYAVGYAHLDTEWRWEYPVVIREYLSKTLRSNFALFEKYPHYIFNFSGANRYRLMKEYFPADYQRLQQYVAAGRWFPAGSSMEESDVNSPSAESIFRQVLYGNEYFRHDFHKASAEFMLPDCFGFPSSLPSILAHSGIKGFSTQKLTWGSSAPVGGPDSPERTPRGTPFNVGIWEGPDGSSVIAAFNPGSYSADITTDLSQPLSPLPPAPDAAAQKDPQRREFRYYQGDWARRVQRNGEVSGLFTDYHYYGTGDIGGSPTESSIKLLEATITGGKAELGTIPGASTTDARAVRVGGGPVRVISAPADQMFLDIKPEQTARLPHYKGELELTNHSAGSLTSQSYQKRWNRKNEILADAAEKASVAAAWLGGRPYPQQRLNDAWTLLMGGQFHDIMAGTATPDSYTYAWNDDIIAMNQFAGVLKSASASVISALDTRAQGLSVVVYNSLDVAREDVVQATISLPPGAPHAVSVFGPDGKEVPSQLEPGASGTSTILFLAKVPSVSYAVYDVRPVASSLQSELRVTESSLENARYKVALDHNGDVQSIFDKSIQKELLAAPARLAFQTEKPHDWPAWNMDWADQQKPPRGYVQGPAKVRIVENGPARVAVEVARESEGSKFVQTIRLAAGNAGDRVEFANDIDWHTREAALKATFPLSASNMNATYNWDVGTIERPSNNEQKFEVASHQWFDLTDQSGTFGTTVLSDCKYGSDKPDNNTLRLTLIYTPGLGGGIAYEDQTTQDFGRHHIVYGLAGHAGDWRKGATDWQAYRLNQPMIAFTSDQHDGALGKQLSLFKTDNDRVRTLAFKKAEQSDEIVVRTVETAGTAAVNVHLVFAAPVISAREVNGQEMPVGAARVVNGSLVTSFTPFQLHTFAVRLAPPAKKVPAPQWKAVSLPYDTHVATETGKPSQGCMDCQLSDPTADRQGHAFPAEMLPPTIDFSGVRFLLAAAGKPNAVTARGQRIVLPSGDFNRIYVLAAAAAGDQSADFRVDDHPVNLKVQEWTGFIGQWYVRGWTTRQVPVPHRPGSPEPRPGSQPITHTVTEFNGRLAPAFIKTADVAWFASHRHNTDGANEAYSYSYLFAYPIQVPSGAKTLILPSNDKIRVLGVTVAKENAGIELAQPLYDTFNPAADAAAGDR